ncbi:MAG: hypothetical protein WA991_08950, partial [Ornithinimicrobium sp.]
MSTIGQFWVARASPSADAVAEHHRREEPPTWRCSTMESLARRLGLRTDPVIFFWSAGLMVAFLI